MGRKCKGADMCACNSECLIDLFPDTGKCYQQDSVSEYKFTVPAKDFDKLVGELNKKPKRNRKLEALMEKQIEWDAQGQRNVWKWLLAVSVVGASLLAWSAFGSELADIKRSVDERGGFIAYKHYLSETVAPPEGEPFAGNCSVFARAYEQAAKRAGYAARAEGYTFANGYSHAVAVVTGKDGRDYVLDNALPAPVEFYQWHRERRVE